ncbi:uncharacterized protein LOC111674497 [Lucilia cuprina]|uniref:uncharacterized protein LOC111674497 n=1 Tax=Lucilia cuprina TaxID=7375 RepID=UPI001F06F892|nr:uncharacterized protein LOC111674497 [Lucilia cuprina]
MSYERHIFLKFFILISIKCAESALLYPQYTVIQLVGSISVPIADLPPNRKVYFDWGLQMNYDMPFNVSSFYSVPIWPTSGSRNLIFSSRAVNKHDFTAKNLYDGLENLLEEYGYDRSCLKQSICELSKYPFDESFANVVTDMVKFFLTPSIHQGFSADEKYEETVYSLAENEGFMGKNCQQIYSECIESPFSLLTTTYF